MFTTILLAHDGSDHAEAAVPFALGLARTYGARIVIVHVDERIAAKGDLPPVRPDEDEIRKSLAMKAERLAAEGVDATIEFATIALGGPARAIVEIATRNGADLIVTGTRGRSAIAGLLVGSVTHRLLHLAQQPILAVPSPG